MTLNYIRLRVAIPLSRTYAYLRRFHALASRMLVPTPSLRRGLSERGFRNVVVWPRVDTDLFRPRRKAFIDAPRPVCACTWGE